MTKYEKEMVKQLKGFIKDVKKGKVLLDSVDSTNKPSVVAHSYEMKDTVLEWEHSLTINFRRKVNCES